MMNAEIVQSYIQQDPAKAPTEETENPANPLDSPIETPTLDIAETVTLSLGFPVESVREAAPQSIFATNKIIALGLLVVGVGIGIKFCK